MLSDDTGISRLLHYGRVSGSSRLLSLCLVASDIIPPLTVMSAFPSRLIAWNPLTYRCDYYSNSLFFICARQGFLFLAAGNIFLSQTLWCMESGTMKILVQTTKNMLSEYSYDFQNLVSFLQCLLLNRSIFSFDDRTLVCFDIPLKTWECELIALLSHWKPIDYAAYTSHDTKSHMYCIYVTESLYHIRYSSSQWTVMDLHFTYTHHIT
jgi:hypothetical protein